MASTAVTINPVSFQCYPMAETHIQICLSAWISSLSEFQWVRGTGNYQFNSSGKGRKFKMSCKWRKRTDQKWKSRTRKHVKWCSSTPYTPPPHKCTGKQFILVWWHIKTDWSKRYLIINDEMHGDHMASFNIVVISEGFVVTSLECASAKDNHKNTWHFLSIHVLKRSHRWLSAKLQ